MKRFLPIIIIAILLIGVGVILTRYDVINLKSSAFGVSGNPQAGDTVVVNYVGTLEDGTEFDSSKKEGRAPIEFIIDGGSMIKGFNDSVKGMKAGQTRRFTLDPKDAYGEEYEEKTMPITEYKEVITTKVPKNVLTGIISQDLPKAQADQILGGSTVGTEKKLGEVTIKVTGVKDDNVTVSINDPQAPFYGKELKVGEEATAQDGSNVTIKSISGEDVEVDIRPDQKVIISGKEATAEELAEFLKTNPEEITLKTKNPQPLAGKALTFEIELIEIKSAAKAATESAE